MPKLKLIEEPRYAGGMCIVLKKPKTHAFSLSFVLDSGGVRSGRRKSISPPSFVRRRIAAIEDYGMCILISQNSCTLRLHMIFLVVYSQACGWSDGRERGHQRRFSGAGGGGTQPLHSGRGDGGGNNILLASFASAGAAGSVACFICCKRCGVSRQ